MAISTKSGISNLLIHRGGPICSRHIAVALSTSHQRHIAMTHCEGKEWVSGFPLVVAMMFAYGVFVPYCAMLLLIYYRPVLHLRAGKPKGPRRKWAEMLESASDLLVCKRHVPNERLDADKPEEITAFIKSHSLVVWLLILPYKPTIYWFEIFEFGRKIWAVASCPIFPPNTTRQLALLTIVLLTSWLIMALAKPYARGGDTVLAHLSQALLVSSFVYAAWFAPPSGHAVLADVLFSTALIGIFLLSLLLEAGVFRRAASEAEGARGEATTSMTSSPSRVDLTRVSESSEPTAIRV